jgi:hypothetical protein
MSTSTLARRRAFPIDMIQPASVRQLTPVRGMDLVDLRELGILPGIAGGAGGFNTTGDLVTRTTDGLDLNVLWNEFMTVNEEYNRQRQAVVDFLTYSVASPVEEVPLTSGGGNFEEASEFGVPRAYRTDVDSFSMGFGFKWFDLANRFTWQFLADASAAQVRNVENIALEADSRLVFTKVMRQLFRNVTDTASIRGNAYNVFGFYNGDSDPDQVPPSYKTNTFTTGHNHFLVSGAAVVDAIDLQDMQTQLTHHGYDRTNGYQTVLMVNKVEANAIRLFRSQVNGGMAGALYDFIPSQGQPGILIPVDIQVLGRGQVPNTLAGLNVIGSYGDILVVEEDYIPAGYMVMFVTGGRDNLQNPIGFREHATPGLRGMRLIKGRNADYPLMDAYYVRGFGTGVRHRGAGVIMQVKTTGTYVPPAQFA